MPPRQPDLHDTVNDVIANLRKLQVNRHVKAVKEGIHGQLNILAEALGAIRIGLYLADEVNPEHMTCVTYAGSKLPSDRFPQTLLLEDLTWILEKLDANGVGSIGPEDQNEDSDSPFFRMDDSHCLFIKTQSGENMFCLLVSELPQGAACRPADIDRQLLLRTAQVFTNTEIHLIVLAENEKQLLFERLLSDLSRTFINLPSDQIDDAIDEGLKRIAEFFDIDRATLFQLIAEHPTGIMTHVYSRLGDEFLAKGIEVTAEDFPFVNRKHLNRKIHYFASLDDLPAEAATDKASFIRWKVKSSFAIPLYVGGKFLGAMGFDSVNKEKKWPETMIKRGLFIGEIFANALSRKRADDDLRQSYIEINQLKDRLQSENTYFQHEIKLEHNFDEIIGNSEALKYVLFKIEQSAPTDATVLILGETGTGKELVARAIHDKSRRRERPLIKVDCGALQRTMIERELFGHEKGAFTGAHQRQAGRFEIADHGTLFLDEVGELPLDLQPKLLRVLQDGEFERLGNPKALKIDVRIIAATNRDLEEEVKQRRFRQDLWYRLNVFPVTIPPLRDRREDIPLLVNWFVNKFSKKMGKKITTIPRKTMDELTMRHWAGNIRELENTIERAVIISPTETLTLADAFECSTPEPPPFQADMTMEAVEREHILRVLKKTNWRISGPKGAAVILDINPSTLRFRINKLGINKFDEPS